MQLIWRNFSEFSLEDLYRLLKLRQDVFILEQQSLYADLDHKDQTARHLLAQEKGLLVGALRLSVEEGEPVMISRVVVAKVARGKGVGMDLMRAALEETEKQWPGRPQFLCAQEVQIPFYERLGFVVEGSSYNDGGIFHRNMWRGR